VYHGKTQMRGTILKARGKKRKEKKDVAPSARKKKRKTPIIKGRGKKSKKERVYKLDRRGGGLRIFLKRKEKGRGKASSYPFRKGGEKFQRPILVAGTGPGGRRHIEALPRGRKGGKRGEGKNSSAKGKAKKVHLSSYPRPEGMKMTFSSSSGRGEEGGSPLCRKRPFGYQEAGIQRTV